MMAPSCSTRSQKNCSGTHEFVHLSPPDRFPKPPVTVDTMSPNHQMCDHTKPPNRPKRKLTRVKPSRARHPSSDSPVPPIQWVSYREGRGCRDSEASGTREQGSMTETKPQQPTPLDLLPNLIKLLPFGARAGSERQTSNTCPFHLTPLNSPDRSRCSRVGVF